MGYTDRLLDDIRAQIQPDDTVVKEARDRRSLVLEGAAKATFSHEKVLSGSLAHGTAICPIHHRDKGLDADGAVVLDSRLWPSLGPETPSNLPPDRVVEETRISVQRYVREHGYPAATATTEGMKRAVLVEFHEPLPEGEDPTVDLVVALRRTAGGLWIPNLHAHRWDPSHPEMHTALFLGADHQRALRVLRARTVRLAKAENKRTDPAPLCSFNIEALAIMYVTELMPLSRALHTLWRLGSQDLAVRPTPDPAHVSGDIKVRDRAAAAARWSDNARRLDRALALDAVGPTAPVDGIRDWLRPLWPDYVPDNTGTTLARRQAALASALRRGKPLFTSPQGQLSASSGQALKRPQSFGARGR